MTRFALPTLRAHVLPPPELRLLTRMTTVSSLMYASDRSRLKRQLASLRQAEFLPSDFRSFDELAWNADAGLFRSICSNLLRHYFTEKRPTICARGPVVLPYPRNFISRTLYGALLNRD